MTAQLRRPLVRSHLAANVQGRHWGSQLLFGAKHQSHVMARGDRRWDDCYLRRYKVCEETRRVSRGRSVAVDELMAKRPELSDMVAPLGDLV